MFFCIHKPGILYFCILYVIQETKDTQNLSVSPKQQIIEVMSSSLSTSLEKSHHWTQMPPQLVVIPDAIEVGSLTEGVLKCICFPCVSKIEMFHKLEINSLHYCSESDLIDLVCGLSKYTFFYPNLDMI